MKRDSRYLDGSRGRTVTADMTAKPVRARALALALCLSLGLAGCSMAPKYVRPEAPVPAAWTTEAGTAGEAGSVLPAWQTFFADPVMNRLIGLALANNRDLKVALLNVERARGQYRIQRADLLPTIEASGGGYSQLMPKNFSRTQTHDVEYQYTAGLGFSSFELDLFGRLQSLTDQAVEEYLSLEEQARSARLTLAAETAAMYLQLVADREARDLARSTSESRASQVALLRTRRGHGLASDLDVRQAETLLHEAEVTLQAAATREGQDANALALLLGCPLPADLPVVRRLADVAGLPDAPAGLPSELLQRRPDILAAEHTLKGANANIGAARASFFPRIGITASVGKMSSDFLSLWDAASGHWVFNPLISLPIFDTGRNLAQLRVSEADRDIAVARYEKAVQTAFREVADCLVQRGTIGAQLKAQQEMVSSSSAAAGHARARYRGGISPYLDVLEAERTLFAAQNALISVRLLRETNALTLYKALGGGWDEQQTK
ncbi:MAG: efflux transporter outer membrane subunit [Desulfovibrionaceae bacterium]|nr:efflux transporter outer membrane subunit [Desulfovibrionaceae bacterium]